MPRHHEHWQRSLDSISRKHSRDTKDVQKGIEEYARRFRKDIKELTDKFGGSHQQKFQRSVEQLKESFERDVKKIRERMYPKVR